jgi:sugar fermentation stimulation protein A
MFVVQRNDACRFRPNGVKDRKFAEALALGMANGVEVYARKCKINTTEILLGDYISLDLVRNNDIK